MKINNKDFKDFNADVVRFSPMNMQFDHDIIMSEYSYYPIMGEMTLLPQQRELVIDFTSEEDISNFSAFVQKESILDLDDGYQYRCYPISQGSISEEAYGAYTAIYPFYVLKQKPLVVTTLTNTLDNIGNIKTNAIYEITSKTMFPKFEMNDVIIHNLPANRKLIIDGIDKLIYFEDEPNISAFDYVEMRRFPTLEAGSNTFIKSHDDVEVVLKYYPTYM